jgi:hypothetical protein
MLIEWFAIYMVAIRICGLLNFTAASGGVSHALQRPH